MIHPDTELVWINSEIGRGVRAAKRIPKGTLTWVRCGLDRVYTRAEVDTLGPLYRPIVERYAYVDHLGRLIFCWDAGRHVNHNCHANSRALGPEAQIAIRDIEAGEELSCDYGECNLDEPLTCFCHSESCRGTIRAADLRAFADQWDAEIRSAVAAAPMLVQPLLKYTADPEGIAAILEGTTPAPSILCVAGT